MANEELINIIEKLSESGWDVIEEPSKRWLANKKSSNTTEVLVKAIEQADKECGSCGCEFDPLYKRAKKLLAVYFTK